MWWALWHWLILRVFFFFLSLSVFTNFELFSNLFAVDMEGVGGEQWIDALLKLLDLQCNGTPRPMYDSGWQGRCTAPTLLPPQWCHNFANPAWMVSMFDSTPQYASNSWLTDGHNIKQEWSHRCTTQLLTKWLRMKARLLNWARVH